MSRALAAALLCAATLAACARTVPVEETASASAVGTPPRPAPRDENIITEDEIRATSATTVFMLLERVRPQYLRVMPGTAPRLAAVGALPLVFVDGRRRGPIGTLRTMQPEEVVTIRRLSPSQAQPRYGPDAAAGIIEVTTRHPR